MDDESHNRAIVTPPAFLPSSYMRSRHPDLFSDSSTKAEYSLTKEMLSYHLETLTNLKDEIRFEEFARRLAERFISPNLRPQTGPTGGGDGKTDSETYPVGNEVALRWFVPENAGAHERWAFAFSAKKDWRGKVRSDVKEIVGTKRGYNRIFFITNQFAPSRVSSEAQDALGAEYGIPVTIIDRTWILEKVFNHDGMDLAVDALGVTEAVQTISRITGSSDFKREAELAELERNIGNGANYGDAPLSLADDCLTTALLSRGLERSREEIDGKFLRAVRVAQDKNLPKQELAAAYSWAWTTYFWFDDFKGFNRLYNDVERLAVHTDSAGDIERLTNLWPLLRSSVAQGKITPEEAKLEVRGNALREALDRISSETSRPNNALTAKASQLLMRVTDRLYANSGNALDDIWTEFQEVFTQAEGLGAFPLESFTKVLTELGELVPESENFDKLYEQMTDIVAVRSSEGEGAKKNSERGFQKLRREKPYEAIRWFGRAVGLLVKEEYQDELISALVGSSFAYEQAGLLWAARNYALSATSLQFGGFRQSGSIDDLNPAILRRYFWSELRLGRVPQILSAYEIEMMVRNGRARTEEQRKMLFSEQMDRSGLLGVLLLRTRFDQLASLATLPDSLERLGLFHARTALLFLAGQVDRLRAEGYFKGEETEEDVIEFFEQWSAYGSRIELPGKADYLLGSKVELKSRVVGSDVIVHSANNLLSLGIGESLLGALESLLATSLSERLVTLLDRIEIRIDPSPAHIGAPNIEFVEETGVTVGIVSHPEALTYRSREEAASFQTWLRDAVFEIFTRLASPSDPERWAEKVLSSEDAFARSITFSNVPVMLESLFGAKTILSIFDWIDDRDEPYKIKRTHSWEPRKACNPDKHEPLKFGEGQPPEGLFDLEDTKHTDYRVVSPIDVRKWDAAKWRATVFQWMDAPDDPPPILGLAFVNNVPAARIFQGWLSRFGPVDENEQLRVAIIRGISVTNPRAYAVLVGPGLDNFPAEAARTVGFVSRINKMYPSGPRNLESFLDRYRQHGRFLLAPFSFPSPDSTPGLMLELAIGKFRLVVREAWEIGENDPDFLALDLNDPPFIPSDVSNAPVIRTLERMVSWERKRGGEI
jgi:hypothetical protein